MSGVLHMSITKTAVGMDKPTHMYDALGRRRPDAVKAVVAAHFENVSQTFGKLYSKVSPFFHLFPRVDSDTEKSVLQLEDAFGRFSTWGHETGAENQTLDHKLRKSKDLHDTVVEALQALQTALDEGIQLVEDQDFQDMTAQLIEKRDDEASVVVAEEMACSECDDSSEAIPGMPLGKEHQSTIVERILSAVEYIEMGVENLIMLGPSLDRPYPQDIDTYSSSLSNNSDISDGMDIERARLEFPLSSNILQIRLGHANWKRRIAQMVIHERTRRESKIRLPRKSTNSVKKARENVAQDAFNFQLPTLRKEKKTAGQKAMFLPLTSARASSASMSDVASIFDTMDFNNGPKLSRVDSMTTLSTMTTYGSKAAAGSKAQISSGLTMTSVMPLPPTNELLFPKMPLQLTEIPKGETVAFTCNFCGYDLEAGGKINTEDDWNQHVLEDLEPYLCTFDRCFSAQETYAQIDEWYRHELESHRIRKTWACPACQDEFGTHQEATDHVMRVHCGDMQDEKEMSMMAAMLRQTLSKQSLGEQLCPLCGTALEASACKEHIGRHLECFALLAIISDGTSEEEDDSSDGMFSQADTADDAMSERGRKEKVLQAFVQEQFHINLERGQQPPDGFMKEGTGGELDLLDDMSYDGSKEGGDEVEGSGQQAEESRRMLMERMFHGKTTAGPTVKRQQQKQMQKQRVQPVNVPPSLTSSSAEKLPLLRTCMSPRNSDFMGRDKELANLYKILSEPGKVCVVSGEGGMGKTALAVEYAWRYEQSYHYIFWVQAETAVGSSDTFCQIAQQLGLSVSSSDGRNEDDADSNQIIRGSGNMDQDTMVRLGREFLEQVKDKRWLMVLDNVERWDDIDVYTPTKTSATNGSILITTRHESLTAPSRPVNYFRIVLPELSVDEGRKLLLHGLPDELLPDELSMRDPEFRVAGEIAGLVGLPLLIVYIAGYIKKAGCTLSDFWEYWNEWRPKGAEKEEELARTSAGSSATAAASKRDDVLHMALRDLSKHEKKVLQIIALFDSDGVQRELLEWSIGDHSSSNGGDEPGLGSGWGSGPGGSVSEPVFLKRSRLRVIISKLKAQKIVTEKKSDQCSCESEVYSVHRLLQSRLLQDLNKHPAERDEIFGLAFRLIRRRLPQPSLETPEPQKWRAFREYLPHVLSLQRAYANPLAIVTVRPFLGLAELFRDGGVLLWQRYVHGDALKLLRSAEKILTELGGEDEETGSRGSEKERRDELWAEINVTVNLLLQYFGISHRKETKERSAAILAYHERRLQAEVGETAGANSTTLSERVLLLNNARADYANTLLQFHDYAQAEPIYEACLATFRSSSGQGGEGSSILNNSSSNNGHAFAVAKLLHHLAFCRMYRRKFDEALALAADAVRIVERLGDDGGALALRFRFDLACIMLQVGDCNGALALHQAIFKSRLGFQGRASYFTLQSQYAVAALYHYLGNLEEAEILMKSALTKAAGRGGKNFWPDAAVVRTKYHLSLVMTERDKNGTSAGIHADDEERVRRSADARRLAIEAKDVLSRMLPYDPEPITGVREGDTLALFDHLQSAFGGRFTSRKLLPYVGKPESHGDGDS